MYGKVAIDQFGLFICEFPVRGANGELETCKHRAKDLVRHLRSHGISSKDYKKMLGLNRKESLLSEETLKSLRKANIKYKNYENLEKGKPFRFRKGSSHAQKYDRSEQTKKRLRGLRKK